jgi:hypothetical protein
VDCFERDIGIDERFAMLYSIRQEDRKVIHAQLFPDVATATERGSRIRQEFPQVNRKV